MRVLVIPDIHLKPWIIDAAEEIYRQYSPDATVFLGDVPDDWGKQNDVALYERTYDRVIEYCRDHADKTWFCYGNHDISYVWRMMESGFSDRAADTVREKIKELQSALPEGHVGFMHALGGCLFSHAGLVRGFARERLGQEETPEAIAAAVNRLHGGSLWEGDSPIWVRPQGKQSGQWREMLWPKGVLQVVGHTPTEKILQEGDLISVDVFSTYRDGTPLGSEELVIIDTESRTPEICSTKKQGHAGEAKIEQENRKQ